MLEKIVESCRFLLNNYPEARPSKSYLDSRLKEESQEVFQFGYFPGFENMSVLSDLVGEEALQKERLLFVKDIEDSLFPRKVQSSYFEDYPLVMPFRDPYGRVAGLIGRTVLSEKEQQDKGISKYKNTKFEKGSLLFG